MPQSYRSKGAGVGIERANVPIIEFSKLVHQEDAVDFNDDKVDVVDSTQKQLDATNIGDKGGRVRFKAQFASICSTPPLALLESQLQPQDSDDEEIPLDRDAETYTDLQHRFLQKSEYGHFPKHMIDHLETIRKTKRPAGVWTRADPRKAYVVVWDHLSGTDDGWERRIVGVGLNRDRANMKAMTMFCKNHQEHMVDSKFYQKGMGGPGNFKGSPFELRTTFGDFYEGNGGKGGCSAWCVNPEGCLGLLAVEDGGRLSMVYVEAQDLIVGYLVGQPLL